MWKGAEIAVVLRHLPIRGAAIMPNESEVGTGDAARNRSECVVFAV